MKKLIIQLVIVIYLCCPTLLFAELLFHPQVTDLQITQKGESVSINYSLTYDETNELWIDLEFSPNNGDVWYAVRQHYDRITGDIGIVTPAKSDTFIQAEWNQLAESGNPLDDESKQTQINENDKLRSKNIRWHISSSLHNFYSENVRFAVIARNRFEGVPGKQHLIIDHKTGFMWPSNTNPFYQSIDIFDSGTRTYDAANNFIEAMNKGEQENNGFKDWHIPSNAELLTLPFGKDKNTHPFLFLTSQDDYFSTSQTSDLRKIIFTRGPQW
jgi:hypothetical protein